MTEKKPQLLFVGGSGIDFNLLAPHSINANKKNQVTDLSGGIGSSSTIAAAFTALTGHLDVDGLFPVIQEMDLTSALMQRQDLCTILGILQRERILAYGINLIPRLVNRPSLSFIIVHDSERDALICRDNTYLNSPPDLNISRYAAIYSDGHQPDASLKYFRQARKVGVMTFLDGGKLRPGMSDLIPETDYAIVSEEFCADREENYIQTIKYLLSQGVKLAGVTLGEAGTFYSTGQKTFHLPIIPTHAIDTTGAGDIFHGALFYSLVQHPERSIHQHMRFARAAATISITRLGTESGIPNLEEINNVENVDNIGMTQEIDHKDFQDMDTTATLRHAQANIESVTIVLTEVTQKPETIN